ncbi:alpha/beta fold hydrolase [Oceanobacillus jeddahense]|uniref:alpha/beta fold hydrolase n=1 Tax=Oceanobacillus jeddahense TaxID=1462527 RepID=UPI00363B7582
MTAYKTNVQIDYVTTEGDTLYFEVRGQGDPLLMISPGGGDGDHFMQLADILSDEFKVITYDRRANARSTRNYPQNFEISQQSRDAVAILRAAGERSAYVLGNSSGANIALDMAKTQPHACRAVISHEPPIPGVLPESKKWMRFFASVYKTGCGISGPNLAALRFIMGINEPVKKLGKAHKQANKYAKGQRIEPDQPRISNTDAVNVLIKNELLPVTNYLPDTNKIMENDVSMFIGVGSWAFGKKTWLARTAIILADRLDCEIVTFPGHHGSFMDMPEKWSSVLRDLLHRAQKENS